MRTCTALRQRLEAAGSLGNQRSLLDDLLPEAFAVVREAGKRVLGMRHFGVQMIGGMVLHEGQIEQDQPGLTHQIRSLLIPKWIDTLWCKHLLQAMDSLQKSAGLRGYRQTAPLVNRRTMAMTCSWK